MARPWIKGGGAARPWSGGGGAARPWSGAGGAAWKGFTSLALALALALSACGGPLPPEDPFHLGQAKDLIGRGNHWYRRGCPAEAADWYLAGLEEARLADRVDLIVTALAALGAAHLRAGKLDLAAEALERALELSSSSPGSPELPTVWGNLGSLAFAAGRLADAKEFWLSALDEAGRRGLNPALYHCDLARLALAEGDEAGFRTRAATALELSETSSDAVRADALNLAARAAMADGDKALAEERLREALSLDRQGENQVGLAQDLETLASLEAASGRAGEAAASLDRAFYLWAALGDKTSQKRVLEALKSLKAESGRPKSLKPYEDVSRRPELFDPLSRLCP